MITCGCIMALWFVNPCIRIFNVTDNTVTVVVVVVDSHY